MMLRVLLVAGSSDSMLTLLLLLLLLQALESGQVQMFDVVVRVDDKIPGTTGLRCVCLVMRSQCCA